MQRSLCLKEVTDDSSSTRVEPPNGVDNQTRDMLERPLVEKPRIKSPKKLSRARKEASAQEVRGYYKQFARAKHLEDWLFGFVDSRKFKAKNHVTCPWILTIKPTSKATSSAQGGEDSKTNKRITWRQTVRVLTLLFPLTGPGFRMSCQVAASKSWDIFHIDLKTAFLQGQL